MNILVTGAAGQLGSEVRKAAACSVHNYIFTDKSELDITDANAVKNFAEEKKIGVIVNCAAWTAVDAAEDNFEGADLLNRQAVLNLAEASLLCDAMLIHISTDYVFDGSSNVPCTEADPAKPLGVYGITKNAGEEALKSSGCRYVILRTAWLYSSYGANFVKTMIRLTGEKDSVNVVFDQTGSPTYAGDLADFIVSVLEKDGFVGHEGIYHFTDDGVCSWYDLAVQTAELYGNKACRIIPCRSWEFPSKAARPAYSVLDNSKLRKTFGWQIPYWTASLKKCIDIIKNEKA